MEEFDNQNQNNFNNYDYFPAFNNNIINTIQPENIEQNFVPFPENNIYINNNNSYTNEQFPEENIYINNNIDNNEYNILPTTISKTIPTAIPTTTISTTPSTIPTAIYTTTIPTTIPTAIPTTTISTTPSNIPTAISTTTIPTTIPTTISTTMPTVTAKSTPIIATTTISTTIPTTTISTTIPTPIPITEPFVEPTITFTITFQMGGTFTFSDNPNNKFKTTFDKFFKEKNLEHYKNYIYAVLYDGLKVDFEKTLSENNIKNGSNILITFNNTPGQNININNNINNNMNNNNNNQGQGFAFHASITKAGKDKFGKPKINQDLPLIVVSVGDIKGFNIFGILDGHGTHGHFIAQFCKNFLINKILQFTQECKSQNIYSPEGIYNKLSLSNFQYIKDWFKDTDDELSLQNNFDYNYSGTTCNLVIQLNDKLICANVGDSRAILIFDDNANNNYNQGIYLLSEDHVPESPQEYQRIINSGGMVDKFTDQNGNKIGPFRVYKNTDMPTYIGLAVSRALGDMKAKECGVSSQPQIKEYRINHRTKFLVVGSDGIWKYLSNEDVRNLGNVYYQYKNIGLFCTNLMVEACSKWKNSIRRDDITVVCVFFWN